MALYSSKGIISDMSEVTSGVSKTGNEWSRMTLILEVPGYRGTSYKQVFQVAGREINDVLKFRVGDRVEVMFSLYAREWNGKMYNNVDLVSIHELYPKPDETQQIEPTQAEQQPQVESLDPAEHTDDLPF